MKQEGYGINKMNILNLATTDEGGAGIASRYFNELFLKSGHNSILVVKESKKKKKNVVVVQKPCNKKSVRFYIKKIKNQLTRLSNRIKTGPLDSRFCFFSVDERQSFIQAKEILNIIPFIPMLSFFIG